MAVCFAQTGVVMAILAKTKNQKLKSLCIPATISGLFGVTEPAIYGITLPMKETIYIKLYCRSSNWWYSRILWM